MYVVSFRISNLTLGQILYTGIYNNRALVLEEAVFEIFINQEFFISLLVSLYRKYVILKRLCSFYELTILCHGTKAHGGISSDNLIFR